MMLLLFDCFYTFFIFGDIFGRTKAAYLDTKGPVFFAFLTCVLYIDKNHIDFH